MLQLIVRDVQQLCVVTVDPLVLAEILSRFLCRQVSLQDIKRWFSAPNSHELVIHQELLDILSKRDLTWPPNAHLFPCCLSYKESPGTGEDVDISLLLQRHTLNLWV